MTDVPYELVGSDEGFCHSPWFEACRRNHTPYIVIRQNPQWADVLWDFITLPPVCDEKIQRAWPTLSREIQDIFQRHAGEDSYLRAKPSLIAFDRLSTEEARCAAGELYVLISSYLPEAGRHLMLPRWHEPVATTTAPSPVDEKPPEQPAGDTFRAADIETPDAA